MLEQATFVTRTSEAQTFDLPGVRFRSLAAPRLGSHQTCVWELSVDAGLDTPEAHTLDRDEVFVVLDGRVRVTPDGAELGVGDAAVVPAGSPIQLQNAGDVRAVLHVAIQAGFSATMADGTAVGTPPWAA
jgi:mannose-6-phosphate isomerase-like protein (cupin superfamily)